LSAITYNDFAPAVEGTTKNNRVMTVGVRYELVRKQFFPLLLFMVGFPQNNFTFFIEWTALDGRPFLSEPRFRIKGDRVLGGEKLERRRKTGFHHTSTIYYYNYNIFRPVCQRENPAGGASFILIGPSCA
jgi:hypothetical protein